MDFEVRNIPGRGRGVVATRVLLGGGVVERAPVIVVPDRDVRGLLDHYVFTFGRGRCALALGVGSLFNHSAQPSLAIAKRVRRRVIEFFALRDIVPGEELTIDYGYTPRGYDGK